MHHRDDSVVMTNSMAGASSASIGCCYFTSGLFYTWGM